MRRVSTSRNVLGRVAVIGMILASMLVPGTTASGTTASDIEEHNCQFVPATYVGTPERDYLAPHDDDGVYQAYAGPDLMFGGPGNDIMCGSRGDDEIHVGLGDDVIFAGYGVDDIYCGRGCDNVYEHGRAHCDNDNYRRCEEVVVLPF